MVNKKIADELADRELAQLASLPFSVEEIIQKLTACVTEAERAEIWHYLDQIMPTLSEAQLARVRVEFAESLKESSRRMGNALEQIGEQYGVRSKM
ncbi:MAG TPA: hypothetical protein PK228_00640 [Saprospiraceae bacterium]|nr:hypothetical protein [Saprospiraceae bacterium]